jgi:hypothetical protein
MSSVLKGDDTAKEINSEKKSFTEKMIISEGNRYKAIFDIFILFLVGYSCFTSIY